MAYDLVIIGGGPAGMSAGLYAARGLLKTLIIEKEKEGGQIVTTNELENYPGGLGDSGPSVTKRMKEQCDAFDVEFKRADVVDMDFSQKMKKVILKDGSEIESKAVIIATGATPRKMNIPGEKEFTGKGVSYCATCDAAFMEGLEVFVVGGGNSAVEEATYLAKFARKVTVVVRGDTFDCDKVALMRAKETENLEFLMNTSITEVRGDGLVESIVLKNNETGEETVHEADEDDGTFGVFVFIGYLPQAEVFKGHVELNEWGYIVSDENMHTDVDGVFVAGDVRNKNLRQVITAAADGAIAATEAEKYIDKNFES
ncbi:MAG: thioredoxin-disulfide reductase [Tissierellia bacterium]|nr:thioredoxin-disulfide reductase [Tissierellia bacterium]